LQNGHVFPFVTGDLQKAQANSFLNAIVGRQVLQIYEKPGSDIKILQPRQRRGNMISRIKLFNSSIVYKYQFLNAIIVKAVNQ
jgi:hypothetical protein